MLIREAGLGKNSACFAARSCLYAKSCQSTSDVFSAQWDSSLSSHEFLTCEFSEKISFSGAADNSRCAHLVVYANFKAVQADMLVQMLNTMLSAEAGHCQGIHIICSTAN